LGAVLGKALPWLVAVVVLAAGGVGVTVWAMRQPVSSTVSVSALDSTELGRGIAGLGLMGNAAPPDPAGPAGAAAGAGGPAGATSLAAWVARAAAATGIPARALQAYAQADLRLAAEHPGCHLNWTTLAGIGSVESNHGRHGGTSLGPDGRAAPPIVGPPLDGSGGNKAIRDTDGGVLDGDRLWDRAVGPMQFIPSTWAHWGVRANGDGGAPDPENIDDATLAAARYLCAGERDMTTGAGWWQAVLSYNNTTGYAQLVYRAAERYSQASLHI
jgi:membrane-bound lytic murein transglycosylase B